MAEKARGGGRDSSLVPPPRAVRANLPPLLVRVAEGCAGVGGGDEGAVAAQPAPGQFARGCAELGDPRGECSWRIVEPDGVEVASADRHFAAGDDPFKDYPDFDWDRPGANRRDARLRALIERHAPASLTVRAVRTDDIGSLHLVLDKEYALDIFPHSSLAREHWRFFMPHHRQEHFIVSGTDIRG